MTQTHGLHSVAKNQSIWPSVHKRPLHFFMKRGQLNDSFRNLALLCLIITFCHHYRISRASSLVTVRSLWYHNNDLKLGINSFNNTWVSMRYVNSKMKCCTISYQSIIIFIKRLDAFESVFLSLKNLQNISKQISGCWTNGWDVIKDSRALIWRH